MKNLFLFLLLLPVFAFGQDSITYVPPTTNPRPVVVDQHPILKLAPLSLIDIDPTVQVAVEIPLRPQWSIQQEVGYGWPSLGLRQGLVTTKPKSTFRARTEIRYYFSPGFRQQTGLQSGPGGFYVAGEALYKQMNHTADSPLPNSLQTPFPLPVVVNERARITRQVYGMHAKIGYQAVVSRSGKTPQFVVDVYMGVGFRIISIRQTGGPSVSGKVYDTWDFTRFEPFEGTLRKPSLAGGIKLGWMINSGKKAKKK